jgi:Tfp pilus assembly protein FimV
MNKLRINALLACLLLAMGGSVLANDPPKEAPKDAKKDEDKPAEPDLPSKPYPKNAVPKAFLPKSDEKKEAAAKPDAVQDKPAEKRAEKPVDKPDEKHAADKHDGAHDAPPVMVAPKRRKMARAATPPAPAQASNPVIQQVAGESVKSGSSDRDAYVAQNNDTLDKVIAKTFPKTPFSMEIMREAFVRANPQLRPPVKNVKLRAGQVVQLPDVNIMRMVVMGENNGATMAVSGDVHYEKKQSLFMPSANAPAAVAPLAAVSKQPIAIPPLPVNVASSAPTQEVSAEEKRKWIRFP